MNKNFIIQKYNEEDYDSLKAYFLSESNLNNFERAYLGLLLFDIGLVDEAIKLFKEIDKNDNDLKNIISKIYVEMALFSFSKGNYSKSSFLLKKSLKKDINKIFKADQWLNILNLNNNNFSFFNKIETEIMNFHFKSEICEVEVEKFIKKYKKSYYRIKNTFKIELPKKIDVYIYIKREDIIGNKLSYSNSFLATINTNLYDEDGHEIAHIFIDNLRKNKYKNDFFSEGIAEVFNNINYKQNIKFKYKIKHVNELNENFHNFDPYFAYKIGKLFFTKLLNKGGINNFTKICENQSWNNLINIYGNQMIDKISEDSLKEYYLEEKNG